MSELIAIEGIDGSGKGTQAAILVDRLRAAGRRCELLSFPRYRETKFGSKIGDFLNGRFGQLDQVSPFLVSLLFAGDRFESKRVLIRALAEFRLGRRAEATALVTKIRQRIEARKELDETSNQTFAHFLAETEALFGDAP